MSEKESYDQEPYNPEQYVVSETEKKDIKIAHAHGSTIISYNSWIGLCEIKQIDVDENYRRRGIAKNMLRYSKEMAKRLGAEAITAQITSRESLDVMTTVFGPDAVRARKVGEYESPDEDEPLALHRSTIATLWYDVGQ